MIAIPVMRSRVAPVLNWCSRVLIFPEQPDEGLAEELRLQDWSSPEVLKLLRGKGVNTLICGALSPELERHARQLHFRVISGVAGEVDQVLQAYRQNRLAEPQFCLPGYRGPGNGKAAGIADFCRCPTCDAKAPKGRGIPCIHVTCPRCGKPMVRDRN